MLKFEFPAERTDICRAVATMLNTIADDTATVTSAPIVQNAIKAEKTRQDKEAAKTTEPTLDEQAVAAVDALTDPVDSAKDEYEQAAVDALLAWDEAAEFSHLERETYGDNLRFAYNNRGSDLVSLEVAAEVLEDMGDPASLMRDTGLIIKTLLQTVTKEEAKEEAKGDKVDINGVPFCAEHCAAAADPFYGSGKAKGQWKKKRGVDQPVYDAWYAAASNSTHAADTTQEIDTTQAFGGQSTTPTPEADANAPKTLGELMGWVAAQQTAETFTKEQVAAAYTACGVDNLGTLFTATPEAQAGYVTAIYAVLTA